MVHILTNTWYCQISSLPVLLFEMLCPLWLLICIFLFSSEVEHILMFISHSGVFLKSYSDFSVFFWVVFFWLIYISFYILDTNSFLYMHHIFPTNWWLVINNLLIVNYCFIYYALLSQGYNCNILFSLSEKFMHLAFNL